MCAPRLMHAPWGCWPAAIRAHCWLLFILVSTKRLLQRCISAGWPSMWSLGLSLLQGRTLSFFLELQEISVGSFHQASEALPNSSTTISPVPGVIHKTAPSTRPLMQVEQWLASSWILCLHSPTDNGRSGSFCLTSPSTSWACTSPVCLGGCYKRVLK